MFKHFISLGWYCGTAASLTKYGGRSFSSTFDWGFFGFPGVIHALDNCFDDFLNEENLSPRYVEADGLIHVVDTKNDMDFNHEVSSLEAYAAQMPAVRKKYRHRIDLLYKTMENFPVCFVRCIRDATEIAYIQKNAEYIASVVGKYNKRNRIIFMVPLGLDIPKDFCFQYFLLNRTCAYRGHNGLRGLFDANLSILPFVCANMSKAQRAMNLLWDLLHEGDIGTIEEKQRIMAEVKNLLKPSKEYATNCFRYIWGREPKDKEVEACLKKFPLREEMRIGFLSDLKMQQETNVPQKKEVGAAIDNEKVTREMVRNCYLYILGREPENEEVLKKYMKAYKNFADMRKAFMGSGEFRKMNDLLPASKEYVTNCFRYICGREPKDREVEACLQKFSLREEMRLGFLSDLKMQQETNVPQKKEVGAAIDNEKVTREMVRNCYLYILGREPENEEVLKKYMKAYKNFADMRKAFLNSEEFRRKKEKGFLWDMTLMNR